MLAFRKFKLYERFREEEFMEAVSHNYSKYCMKTIKNEYICAMKSAR